MSQVQQNDDYYKQYLIMWGQVTLHWSSSLRPWRFDYFTKKSHIRNYGASPLSLNSIKIK